MRDYLLRNTFFFKVLLSYFATGTILVSLLSYLMYESYSKSMVEEIERHADRMLGQSREVVETYWSSTLDHLNQIHLAHRELGLHAGANGSAPLFYALYADDLNAVQMGEISRKLKEITDSNPIIHSVYVYNRRADRVFSSVAVSQPVKEFFDQDIIARFSSLRSDISYIPRHMQYRLATDTVRMNTISVIYVEDATADGNVSILVFNLKQEALQHMIQPGPEDGVGQIFLVNGEGTVISHPRLDWFNRNLKEEPHIARILDSVESGGMFHAEIAGRRSLVAYAKSDARFGWTFVSVGDYELLLRKFTERQKAVTLLILSFIALSILVGLFFTGSFYKPVRSLLGKLKRTASAHPDLAGEARPVNEYDYINRSLDYLIHNVSELEATYRAGRPAIHAEFLKQLLRGAAAGEEDAAEQAAKLRLNLKGPLYAVCVWRISSYADVRQELTDRDRSLFRFGLMNVVLETLAPDFPAEAVEGEGGYAVVIISLSGQSPEAVSGLRNRLSEALSNVRRFLKVTAQAALGCPVDRRCEIRHSYTDALRLMDFRLCFGKEALIGEPEIRAMTQEPYRYPEELERSLFEAVRAADRDRMLLSIDDFLARVMRFSYDSILMALTQLVLSLMAARPSVETEEPDNGRRSGSYKTVIGELAACEDKEDLRGWLVALCDNWAAVYRFKRDQKNREIVEKLTRFVGERYGDPNLTVEAVSEHVGLSPNYIRTIFKNQTGQSLSAYISDLRFQEARRKLLGTDEPVNRIAESVGFGSAKYFYAAFKKATGHTPEEFRRKYRNP